MLKAVIFDKDGVLVDTEGIVDEALTLVINANSKAAYDREDSLRYRGITADKTFEILKEKYKIDKSISNLQKEYHDSYVKVLNSKQSIINVGVIELLESLKSNGIKMAVGTNSNRDRTRLTMKGLEEYFEAVVTSDMIENPKPAPDHFLKCAELIGVMPEECVVVGDSINDAKAAREGNMKFVFHSYTPGQEMEITPDLTVNSMKELNYEKIKGLFD